ncbi:class I SAM-dependent methyltransferase [Reichenbachiella versicolor]|uniref:class I SAM-dependent methyltransferase n=1 Tax=Reichenbachiella versicolor TaxID=1821036 RepID=UPI000D6DDAC1|nr:class I SAM-dependent methyltransferase [Reichenbachiella versicolor]
MAESLNSDQELTLEELASHLRKPEGEKGKEVGTLMNDGNKYICLNTYHILAPQNKDHILEIGMGNGFFIRNLLEMADDLSYVGLDFSSTMVAEASRINEDLIDQNKVQFECASIEKIPFPDNSFDSITTTNTLYFWPQPNENIKELIRVLKPNGKLLCAYRSKNCLDSLELTQFGFQKYEINELESMFKSAGLSNISTQIIEEPDLELDGIAHKIEGIFTSGVKA